MDSFPTPNPNVVSYIASFLILIGVAVAIYFVLNRKKL